MSYYRPITLLLIVQLWCSFPLATAQQPDGISAYLDRSQIGANETVLLTIELTGNAPVGQPDVSALERDFEILDRSSNQQLSMMNGVTNIRLQWLFELQPKRAGQLSIPSLTLGPGLSTEPLGLLVSAAARDNAVPMLFEYELLPDAPYVQSQIRYTQRFFYPPTMRDVSVPANLKRLQIGDDVYYTGNRDGQNYRVLERHFALFPQSSGDLTIPAFTFSGRQPRPGQRRGTLLRPGRRISVSSDAVTLQVRPKPPSYSGQHWLPAAELRLQEDWSEQPLQLRVGEPVTRTVTLQAKGLSASQLPPLDLYPGIDTNWFTQYPDQPQRQTSVDQHWLVAQQQQRVAMIPTQAGEFQLPAITLDWWDINADQQATATIAARTVTVLAALTNAPTTPTTPIPAVTTPASSLPTDDSAAISVDPADASWRPLSFALLAVWLLTLFGWGIDHYRRRHPRTTAANDESRHESARQARSTLRRACADNNPRAAAHALLALAAAHWPERPPLNLDALAARLDTPDDSLNELRQALYGRDRINSWQGESLWQQLRGGLAPLERDLPSASSLSPLPPFHPHRS